MVIIIAALASNRVIGNKGKIPWSIPEDLAHFKELTMGNVLVMGRHTYEEIGHPLSGRLTYLVSSKLTVEEENCHTVDSLSTALSLAGERDLFICGGERLYREALTIADRLYLTEINQVVNGDAYFPEIPKGEFVEIERVKNSEMITFVTYERKNV